MVEAVNVSLFFGRELDVEESTNLSVKVDTVDELQLGEVHAFNAEEILVEQFLVAVEKRATDTGVAVLHLAFDAGVFNDVEERLEASALLREAAMPTSGRRFESVTNFVTNQEVIEVSRHFFKDGKNDRAILQVKIGSRHLLVFDHYVFGRQQLGENRLFSKLGHHKTSSINQSHYLL